jgi:hypothetical protein
MGGTDACCRSAAYPAIVSVFQAEKSHLAETGRESIVAVRLSLRKP